jgi:hypothetical protein
MRMLSVPASILTFIIPMPTTSAGTGEAMDTFRVASEVRIQQAKGRMSARYKPLNAKAAKTTPEGTTNPNDVAKGSPTIPMTCNQQNASSPACYSATQQARPAPK